MGRVRVRVRVRVRFREVGTERALVTLYLESVRARVGVRARGHARFRVRGHKG